MIRDDKRSLPALEKEGAPAVTRLAEQQWLRCAETGTCELGRVLRLLPGEQLGPEGKPRAAELRFGQNGLFEAMQSLIQQRISERIIKAQEQERKRIAREIHDGPAQLVAGILLQADYCRQLWQHDPERVAPELDNLKETVRQSLEELRRIIYDLRTVGSGQKGLAEELGGYLDEVRRRKSLAVTFNCRGVARRVDQLCEITLFRVVQEALNNVVKHAEAGQVVVELGYLPMGLHLTVTDDGKGFDPETAGTQEGHYGLLGMRERVSLINGTLRIISAPGQGTTIDVTIPVTRGGESWEKSE